MNPTTETEQATNESPTRTRRTYSAQEKADLLALFAESKVSAADFCRDMDVHPATFSLWRRQSGGGGAAAADFAEVRVAPALSSTLTIALPGGAVLSVPPGANAVWIGQLVRQLS